MKRNNFFSRFIVVTLTAALLLVSGSRAIRVSALADPVPITAVYDTQIIQLADYVDHLPQPSVDIFYILCGVLAAAQLGGQEYKLEDPYATSSDVVDWFKSLGIRLYNTVIGLAPNQDPILGFDVRPYVKPLVAAMMGNAVLSRNYGSVQEFLDSDDDVLVPFKRDIQQSINVIWQIQGGPYHWQFDTEPFSTTVAWNTETIPVISNYATYLNELPQKHVRINSSYYKNEYVTNSPLIGYDNIFVNTHDNTVYFVNDSGQKLNAGTYQVANVYTYAGDAYKSSYGEYLYIRNYSIPSTFNTYVELIRYLYNHPNELYYSGTFMFWEDFVEHVYVGTNWINKQELFNVQDLNIGDNGNDFYNTPTEDNLLIDIKNLITDLVDDTNIWTNIINNVYDPDGTQVINPPTIRVSVDLTPITELLDPPIPVNLNDIAELTDNSYLERVKEHARNAGDIFANYVAFWHNCDSDLVYTFFGAGILVLVGAFIGKWGHS